MMKYDFEDALRDLITEWHDEKGFGFEEIIDTLERELRAAQKQHADETSNGN